MVIPVFFPSNHFLPSHLKTLSTGLRPLNPTFTQLTFQNLLKLKLLVVPRVRKEDISLEVEDSRYIIIQTEATVEPCRSFHRRFWLPRQVDVSGITADYGTRVLTVTVPRSFVRMEPADVSKNVHLLARAD